MSKHRIAVIAGDGIGNEGSGFYPLVNTFLDDWDFVTETAGGHGHSVNLPATTSTEADTGLPYIQLIMCEKD